MLSVEDAQKTLLNKARERSVPQIINVPLVDAAGKILAKDYCATIDIPPADNSAMDGYAYAVPENLLSQNTVSENSPHKKIEEPLSLPISARIAAGDITTPLKPGTAARIFTGAEIPEGANCIAIQENCESDGDIVTIHSSGCIGDNIRRQGQDVEKHSVLLEKGEQLTAENLGLLASSGYCSVEIYAPLEITLITTGNEVIPPGSSLTKGQIYNSNAVMLATLFTDVGASIKQHIHLPDDVALIRQALQTAANDSDLIITVGGASVGEEDHLMSALQSSGQVELWKVALKPGKPFTYGIANTTETKDSHNTTTPVLGLPGNPTSAYVTAILFGIPFVKTLQGQTWSPPLPYKAPLLHDIKKPRKRREYLRVKRTPEGLVPYENQSSGVLSSICRSDGLAVILPNRSYSHGEYVDYYPWSELR